MPPTRRPTPPSQPPVPRSIPEAHARWIDSCRAQLSPRFGWQMRLWNLSAVEAVLEEHRPEFLPMFRGFPKLVQRIDMAKYLLLEVFGGGQAGVCQCWQAAVRRQMDATWPSAGQLEWPGGTQRCRQPLQAVTNGPVAGHPSCLLLGCALRAVAPRCTPSLSPDIRPAPVPAATAAGLYLDTDVECFREPSDTLDGFDMIVQVSSMNTKPARRRSATAGPVPC